jgi:uncharacterized membrane protein YfcA
MDVVREILIGSTVGFLSGLFGIGGSSIATPLVRTFLYVSPLLALATPLPVTIPTAISGAFAYSRERLVLYGAALYTALFGVPAVIVGALLTNYITGKELMLGTAVFVGLIGVSFIFRRRLMASERDERHHSLWTFVSVGTVVGLISGVLANGGGILIVPAFVKILKMPIKQAFATSLVVVALMGIPGSITHFLLGHIDVRLMLTLSIGVLPMAYLGAKVAIHSKPERLEKLYGAMMILLAVYFFVMELHEPTG